MEEGEPRWVVLRMSDYEKLVAGSAPEQKKEADLVSYQEDQEKVEAEPELYFEEVEEKREDLSTESDVIPF